MVAEVREIRCNLVVLRAERLSSVAVAAAHHLASLLDYADLDGSLLLADDPYEEISLSEGVIDFAGTKRTGTDAVQR